MKKNETLIYKLTDVGDETVTMEVRLHKTPSRYWSFLLSCDQYTDIADQVMNYFGLECGFLEKFQEHFLAIPSRGKVVPKAMMLKPVYCSGSHFPDWESIIQLIECVFLPCWRYAADRILEFRGPRESWYTATRKAEDRVIYHREA